MPCRTLLQLYEHAELPPSRERRARILAKQEDVEGALALCEEIDHEPLDEEEAEFAVQFSQRLKKKLGQKVHPVPTAKVSEEPLTLPAAWGNDEEISVEWQVVAHLEAEGHQAFYVENLLWRGLFGLAFWDILFMPVRGAFFNLYPTRPTWLVHPGIPYATANSHRGTIAGNRKRSRLAEANAADLSREKGHQ